MLARGIADEGPDPFLGSTDMGNVSQVLPAIHPDLAICEDGVTGTLDRCSGTPPRHHAPTRPPCTAATLVAQTAYDLFAEPELVAAAWREFRG